MSQGWSLSDLQRLREEIEIRRRLDAIEHERKMRQLLGDDVYEFMQGPNPFRVTFDPDAYESGGKA
ncbi:MAG TPA: hypothetical protein VIQ30_23765 [Pseudonocardia sp.]